MFSDIRKFDCLRVDFRLAVVLVAVVSMLCFAGGSVAAPVPADDVDTAEATAADEPAEQFKAVITKVNGKHVQASDDGQSWRDASVGMELGRSGAVRTGFSSSCELSFGEHSVVQVQPLSAVKVADFSGTQTSQQVRADLYYGGVRCGVEKGRIDVDTKISTPVSTLGIRGTMVYVEYNPATRRCMLRVLKDGPADATVDIRTQGDCSDATFQPYELQEGMRTDCCLSRYLELAIFDRTVWPSGSMQLGDVTEAEADSLVYIGGFDQPTDGALEYGTYTPPIDSPGDSLCPCPECCN